ncbi:MAG: T9SS type A sorting domain-containing protein [Luteibaculaceae bacterium]
MKKIYTFVGLTVFGFGSVFAQVSSLVQTQETFSTDDNAVFPQKEVTSFNQVSRTSVWSNNFSDPTDWVIDNQGITLPNTGFSITNQATGQFYWGGAAWGTAPFNSTSGGNFLLLRNGGTGAGTFGTPDFYSIKAVDPFSLEDLEGSIDLEFDLVGARFVEDIEFYFSTDNTNFTKVGDLRSSFPPLTGAGGSPFAPNPQNPIRHSITLPTSFLGEDEIWLEMRWIPLQNGPNINHIAYYYGIDDIAVVNVVEPNASMLNIFHAPYWQPSTLQGSRWEDQELRSYVINEETNQAPPLTPGAVIFNNGGVTLTNAILTVTINGPADFSETLLSIPRSIAVGAFDTLIVPNFLFTSTMPTGVYTLNYSFAAEQTLPNPAAVTNSRTVRLSNWEMAKDLGTRTGAFTNTTGNNNAAGNYRIGPGFYIYDDVTIYSLGFNLDAASTLGESFEIAVWDADYNGPNPESFLDGPSDIEVTANMINNFVYVDLEDPVFMEEGEGVIIYLTYFQDSHPTNRVFLNLGGSSVDLVNYIRVLDGATNCCFITSHPMIRMNLNPTGTVNVEGISKKEVFLKAFPNPSNDNFEIQYVLENDAQVLIELVDITGKVIMNKNEGRRASGVQHNFTIDGRNLTSGMYFYSLIVDGKRHTKKLIKN